MARAAAFLVLFAGVVSVGCDSRSELMPDAAVSGGAGGPAVSGDAGSSAVSGAAGVSAGTPSCPSGVAGRFGAGGGEGSTTWCATGSPAPAVLRGPKGIASDGAGKLYVADADNRLIRQIDVASGAMTTLAGSPYEEGDYRGPTGPAAACNIDGTGAAARFASPTDVVAGGDGNLYVSDISAHVIRKIVIATGAVTTLAGEANVPGSDDGVGSEARFDRPGSLASDGQGRLYVADTWSFTIREVDVATGAVTTVAGFPLASGKCDGIGAAAGFGFISSLTTDGAGHLYAADMNTIRKIDLVTGAVTTEFDSAGQFLEGWRFRFNGLRSLAYDGMGNLYLSAATPSRVDIATGQVETLMGWAATDIASDGAGTLFLLNAPSNQIGMVVTATGEVSALPIR